MSLEQLAQEAPEWLKQHHPELYVKTENIHPLLPFICMIGFDQSKPPLLPPLSFVEIPNKLKALLGRENEVPHNHFHSQEWQNMEKTNAHLKFHQNAIAAYIVICGENTGFDFFQYFISFIETKIGSSIGFICGEVRRNMSTKSGHKAHEVLCASTRLSGFLDAVCEWQHDEDLVVEHESSIEDLFDPHSTCPEEIWNFMAAQVFTSGKPPSREELIDFCKRWTNKKRSQNTSATTVQAIRSCWVTHALWCQRSDAILEMLPFLEKGKSTEDYEKAISSVNTAISRLGYSRHVEHQKSLDLAIKRHEEFAKNVWTQ